MENFNKILGEVIHKSLVLFFIFGITLALGSALSLNNNVGHFLSSLVPWGTGNVNEIDPNHLAYAENLGWIDFSPTYDNEKHSILVTDVGLTGYAYSENAGWIHLDYDDVAGATNTTATNWGVTNDGAGNLAGYAYAENLGWINFNPTYDGTSYGVKIDDEGIFSGYAYSENAGWISFNCSNTNTCSNNGGYDFRVVSDGQYYNQVATTLTIQTQPAGNGCYQQILTTQPSVLVKDQYGVNMSSGVVTASLASGSGALKGTITANISNGLATFTNLGYSLALENFTINFTDGSATATSVSVGPLSNGCGGGIAYVPSTPSGTTGSENSPTPSGTTGSENSPTPSGTTGSENPPSESGTATNGAEIINYVSNELQKTRLSLGQLTPSINQPTTTPPSNLQPIQPPSTVGPSGVPVDNKGAIVQVLQKLLQALTNLLNLSL